MKNYVASGIVMGFAALLGGGTALADIEVAFVGPVTGQVAALGEQGNQGAKRAVADINAAGGINGEKLVLEIGDDACDPKQAVNVANQMASKGVKFVAGHLCSGASIPASNTGAVPLAISAARGPGASTSAVQVRTEPPASRGEMVRRAL